MENNKSIEKWKIVVISIATVVISMLIGVFIGDHAFREAFITFEYNGSTVNYVIKHGQVCSSSATVVSDGTDSAPIDKLLHIDLSGIHNNNDAIKVITQQVRENGGLVLSVCQP